MKIWLDDYFAEVKRAVCRFDRGTAALTIRNGDQHQQR
jgi:hypothetical protein